jgi:agmatinase
MATHFSFPGANTPRERAAYMVYGAPLDVSTSMQPGTRSGPRRIRRLAHGFEDYDHRTNVCFSDREVSDAGDLDAWENVWEYLAFLEGELADITSEGAIPLLLGGEHTVSIAGVRATDPDVFVCLDAHLDLRPEYRENAYSHATVTHHALDVADQAVIIGARAGSEAEWERTTRTDVTVVSPEDASEWVPADTIGDDQSVYLSVDIDAADPGFAPGTGTKEPFGLSPREMRAVVRAVAPHCVGYDTVEVNDRDDGQAAVLAGKLLREFVFAHAQGTERS